MSRSSSDPLEPVSQKDMASLLLLSESKGLCNGSRGASLGSEEPPSWQYLKYSPNTTISRCTSELTSLIILVWIRGGSRYSFSLIAHISYVIIICFFIEKLAYMRMPQDVVDHCLAPTPTLCHACGSIGLSKFNYYYETIST